MSMGHPAANIRVAGYYAAGATAMMLLVVYGWPWTVPLLWPTLAMAVLVAAYLGVGPAVYGKRNGILPRRTRLVMAPTLLGQWASLKYYLRRSRPWDEAVPGLVMGRVLSESECNRLIQNGATAVLDLTAEFSEKPPLRSLVYLNVPLLDLTAPTTSQLQAAVDFIGEQVASGGIVFVHCKVGYSRTATAVGAYLMASGQRTSLDDVLAHLRAARPGIVIRPEAVEALRVFQSQTLA